MEQVSRSSIARRPAAKDRRPLTHRRHAFLYLLWCCSLALISARAVNASPPPPIRVAPAELDANSLKYHVYRYAETKEISLENIQIWDKAPKRDLPTNFVYYEELDLVQVLLSNGLASIRDESRAPANWLAAQRGARAQRIGMWAPPPPPMKAPAVATDTTSTVTETTSTNDLEDAPKEPSSNTNTLLDSARKLFTIALAALGGLFSFIGLKDLIIVLRSWFTRHRVYLIMIGEPSVGKSWTWARLNDPNIPVTRLREIKRTIGIQRAQLPQRMPFGRYELMPIFLDVGGDEPGPQLDLLTDHKRLRFLQRLVVPQKRLWIIHVSTTPRANIVFSSAVADKIDNAHIEQELGALRTVEGVLASKNAPKPEAVLLAIAKVDVFVEHDPNTADPTPAITDVLRLFERHADRIEKECKQRDIPFRVVLTSSLKNWGTQYLLQVLNQLYYPVQTSGVK